MFARQEIDKTVSQKYIYNFLLLSSPSLCLGLFHQTKSKTSLFLYNHNVIMQVPKRNNFLYKILLEFYFHNWSQRHHAFIYPQQFHYKILLEFSFHNWSQRQLCFYITTTILYNFLIVTKSSSSSTSINEVKEIPVSTVKEKTNSQEILPLSSTLSNKIEDILVSSLISDFSFLLFNKSTFIILFSSLLFVFVSFLFPSFPQLSVFVFLVLLLFVASSDHFPVSFYPFSPSLDQPLTVHSYFWTSLTIKWYKNKTDIFSVGGFNQIPL